MRRDDLDGDPQTPRPLGASHMRVIQPVTKEMCHEYFYAGPSRGTER
jgi:hypothetical protein